MAKSRSTKAIILSSGKALTVLVGILSTAVLARLFTKDDYATYRQTMLAYTFAAPFLLMGFNQALYYFLPSEKERPRGVLVENLLLLASGGLVMTLFLVFGGNELLAWRFNNPDLATTLLLLAPYPLLMGPLAATGACLMARDRAGQLAIFNVLSRIVMLGAVVLPVCVWRTPSVAILGTVVGTALSTGVALLLMFRACSDGDWKPAGAGIRSQVRFGVPLGLAGLAGATMLGLDKVMVAALCPPEEFAVYINGAMEVPLVGIVIGSVTSVLVVDYVKLLGEGRISEMLALIRRASTKCALILIPAMVFLLCVAPEFMRFLFGEAYGDSASPFRIYLLLLPRSIVARGILLAAGRSRHLFFQQVLALAVNVVFTYYAIGAFGATGAAVATVCTVYLVALPYQLIVIRSIMGRPVRELFSWGDLLKVAVASALSGVILLGLRYVLPPSDIVVLMLGVPVFGLAFIASCNWLRLIKVSELCESVNLLWGKHGRGR